MNENLKNSVELLSLVLQLRQMKGWSKEEELTMGVIVGNILKYSKELTTFPDASKQQLKLPLEEKKIDKTTEIVEDKKRSEEITKAVESSIKEHESVKPIVAEVAENIKKATDEVKAVAKEIKKETDENKGEERFPTVADAMNALVELTKPMYRNGVQFNQRKMRETMESFILTRFPLGSDHVINDATSGATPEKLKEAKSKRQYVMENTELEVEKQIKEERIQRKMEKIGDKNNGNNNKSTSPVASSSNPASTTPKDNGPEPPKETIKQPEAPKEKEARVVTLNPKSTDIINQAEAALAGESRAQDIVAPAVIPPKTLQVEAPPPSSTESSIVFTDEDRAALSYDMEHFRVYLAKKMIERGIKSFEDDVIIWAIGLTRQRTEKWVNELHTTDEGKSVTKAHVFVKSVFEKKVPALQAIAV